MSQINFVGRYSGTRNWRLSQVQPLLGQTAVRYVASAPVYLDTATLNKIPDHFKNAKKPLFDADEILMTRVRTHATYDITASVITPRQTQNFTNSEIHSIYQMALDSVELTSVKINGKCINFKPKDPYLVLRKDEVELFKRSACTELVCEKFKADIVEREAFIKRWSPERMHEREAKMLATVLEKNSLTTIHIGPRESIRSVLKNCCEMVLSERVSFSVYFQKIKFIFDILL